MRVRMNECMNEWTNPPWGGQFMSGQGLCQCGGAATADVFAHTGGDVIDTIHDTRERIDREGGREASLRRFCIGVRARPTRLIHGVGPMRDSS